MEALKTLAPVLLEDVTSGPHWPPTSRSSRPGIIMAQNGCGQEEAMTTLAGASKVRNKMLQDFAKEQSPHLSGETPTTFFKG